MADLNAVALGFEIAIGFGLACQVLILVLLGVVLVVARIRGPGPLARVSFYAALGLAPIACGFVGYQCLQYWDYIRGQSDDPIASTKLAGGLAAIRPAAISSVALCVLTFAGCWAVARFGRFSPRPIRPEKPAP